MHLVVVALSDFHHTFLSVQALSNHFVCLHKLVDLSGKLIILVRHYTDVTIHGVDLHLQVSVVLNESRVRVSRTFELFAHVHELVFLLSDLGLELLNTTRQLHVLAAFIVDAALQVSVFVFVTSLELFQVVQFVHEVVHLDLEHVDLSVRVFELLLFSLQVEGLLIDQAVELLDLVKRL